jgi:hypothetical protein
MRTGILDERNLVNDGAKLDGIINPMLFKGEINIPADFPTLTLVQNGWTYRIKTDVEDSDASKTHTHQSFLADAEIAWNGTNWTDLGYGQVKSVAGKTGIVTLVKADVGLTNVDDKSEATIITDVKADTDVASAISLKHSPSGQFNQSVAGEIVGLTDKSTPLDADVTLLESDANSNAKRKLSWSNIKATLKTYFDTLYTIFVKNDGSVNPNNLIFGGDMENWSAGITANYQSAYPSAQSDIYVKATTKLDTTYQPYYATDPTKSLTGHYDLSNSWLSSAVANQRFHIDLGSAKVIKRIYYENQHYSGTETDRGVKNFTFWGSNTAGSFSELTYGTDTGWTEITPAQTTFDQHTGSDVVDPKYIIVTNTTAYRYYAFKFVDNWGGTNIMGVRRIELQESTWNPPDGWSFYPPGSNVVREASIIKQGTYSAKITRAGADCWLYNTNYATNPILEKGFVYWRGRELTYGAWVNATVANRARICIQDDGGYAYSSYHNGNGMYQWLSVTKTIASNMTYIATALIVDTGDTSAYFDGAMCVEGASAFAFSDKPVREGVWSDYFATSTIVGWGTPIGTIYTKKIGKTVFVAVYLVGGSNSITTSFTVPYTSAAAPTQISIPARVQNDTVILTAPGLFVVYAGSNIIRVFKDFASNDWIASGDKAVYGQFWYESI